MAKGQYKSSIKNRLSLIYFGGLFVTLVAVICIVIIVTFNGVSSWLDDTQTEVARLRYRKVSSGLQSAGTLISNEIQNGFTDLHMVSNAESIIQTGVVP